MIHPENDQKYTGLNVNKGVAQPPSVNPYLKRRRRENLRTLDEYVDGILSGNRVILSQVVTLVESSLTAHRDMAQAIIEKCLPHSGNAIRVGITGVPGAGKSTSIDTFGMHLLEKGHKLAVWLSTHPANYLKEVYWVTKPEWRNSRLQRTLLYALPFGRLVGRGCRKTRETIILCEAAASTTFSWRPWAWDNPKQQCTPWSIFSS